MDAATYREFKRLESLKADDYVFRERTEVRQVVYSGFKANCSMYMVAVIMTDSLVTQNEDNELVYIAREQKLIEKWIDPINWTGVNRVNYVRMRLYVVDWLTTFYWPATSWIFADPYKRF